MDEIQIGDIIEPTTPTRRKKLGKGVIVACRRSGRLPITAVFPFGDGSFVNYDFKEGHVHTTEATKQELKLIMGAAEDYEQLMAGLNHI